MIPSFSIPLYPFQIEKIGIIYRMYIVINMFCNSYIQSVMISFIYRKCLLGNSASHATEINWVGSVYGNFINVHSIVKIA